MNQLINICSVVLNNIGRWFGNYMPVRTIVTKQVSNTVWSKHAGASAPQDSSILGTNPQVHLSKTSPEPAAPAISINCTHSQALTWQTVVFVLRMIGAAALSLLLIQRTFRLRSIKQEGLKRIAVEYRRFKGISFRNVALKPNMKTNIQIKAMGAITAKK